MTHLQSFKVEALIFCEGTESVKFISLKGPTLQAVLAVVEGLLYPVPPGSPPSLQTESVQAIPSPTDVPIITPTGWKTVSNALVQSFDYGGIDPFGRVVGSLKNHLHLPLSAQCGMIIGKMMHSAACIESSGDLFDQNEKLFITANFVLVLNHWET